MLSDLYKIFIKLSARRRKLDDYLKITTGRPYRNLEKITPEAQSGLTKVKVDAGEFKLFEKARESLKMRSRTSESETLKLLSFLVKCDVHLDS